MPTSRSTKTSSSAAPRPDLTAALADLPPRVRVHDLARRAGLNSKETIAALAESGVVVGAASSSIDRDVAETFLTGLLGGAAAPTEVAAPATPARKAPARRGRSRAATAESDAAPAGESPAERGDAAATPRGGTATRGDAEGGAARAPRSSRAAKKPAAPVDAQGEAPAAEAAAAGGAATDETAGDRPARSRRGRGAGTKKAAAGPAASSQDAAQALAADETASEDETSAAQGPEDSAEDAGESRGRRRRRGGRGRRGGRDRGESAADHESENGDAGENAPEGEAAAPAEGSAAAAESDDTESGQASSDGSSRRSRRRRGRAAAQGGDTEGGDHAEHAEATADGDAEHGSGEAPDVETDEDDEHSGSRRRRRRRHRRGEAEGEAGSSSAGSTAESTKHGASGVQGVRGSTRLEAKRQRRRDSRDSRRRPQILTEAEFLARRESVERVMAVRQRGDLAQVALLEDGVLVEHFVSQHGNASMIGGIYLGRVQNVLPSMEAAFVDIGRGRNAVLYAGEVNWDMAGLEGRERRIETALSGGDTVLVQISKDPIGHKGARLTTQISLPGRFLVYVPGGGATGISRKLPDTERKRLKKILDKIVPADAGVIIRTAAEGVGEEDLAADVERLKALWQEISEAARKGTDAGSAPKQLYAEPDTLIKVVRDLFNSDISRLLVDGDRAWESISEYVLSVAPELADRVSRYIGDRDVFESYRIDEQIAKALQRKVRLPSGGSLVIDRTEAMTVIDVNTGKFTGSGGNLEETVTRNNLEAAEEIVRQLRLRDIGGIIVVDFIDMVLESNRDLVLQRLTECLGRDRTRHQVAEVTSLGLIQMTRKRMGLGLVEAFSEPCAACNGRGIVLHDTPSDSALDDADAEFGNRSRKGRKRGKHHEEHDDPTKFEPLVVERVAADVKPDPRGPKPPSVFRPEADGTSNGHVDGSTEHDGAAASVAEAEAETAESAAPAAEAVVDSETVVTAVDGADGTGSEAPGTAAEPTDGAAAAAPTTATPTALDAAPAPEVAAKPTRRRRAAGRPAGAPARSGATVDMVLPALGAAD